MRKDKQLRLQMILPPVYDYGTWIRHAGVEHACNRLALWRVHGGVLWLSSSHVAGKSHLLRTFAADQAGTALLDLISARDEDFADSGQMVQSWMQTLQGNSHWLIDVRSGALPKSLAHALFHLLERARDLQCSVIIAWRGQVDDLPPEISSRLLAMEKVDMSEPANDDELLRVLRSSAGNLQWEIREQVLQSMLTYLPRELDVLVTALKMLETNSFEQKHKPNPAWVKQQLMDIAKQLNHSCNYSALTREI